MNKLSVLWSCIGSLIAMRPCLDEAVGRNIRERAAWMIVSGEMIKLASLYAIQLGSTAEEISALARDCFNEASSFFL